MGRDRHKPLDENVRPMAIQLLCWNTRMGVGWLHHKGDLSAVSSSKKKNFKIDFLQTSARYRCNGCISWYYISWPIIDISTKCARWIAIMALSISTEHFIGLFLLHSKNDDVIQLWSLVMPEENVSTDVDHILRANEPEMRKQKRHKPHFRLKNSSRQLCYSHSTTHRQCQRNRNGAQ